MQGGVRGCARARASRGLAALRDCIGCGAAHRRKTLAQDAAARARLLKAAGLVPSRGGRSSAGVVRRCDRRGVDGWALDGCPGQTARLTGVACLSVPCTPRAVLSHGRVPLTRVAAMDLNNSYGSARSADMQYGGLNTRFCSCIASSPFANSLLLYSICCLPAPLPLPSHASASAH